MRSIAETVLTQLLDSTGNRPTTSHREEQTMSQEQTGMTRNASGTSPPDSNKMLADHDRSGMSNPRSSPYGDADTIAWHYTTGECFIGIVKTGCILPTMAGVSGRERPAVWFTLNQFWEPTANKGWLEPDGTRRTMSREETCAKGGGLVRFGVTLETARYDWREFKKRSRIHPRVALALAQSARSVGSDPNDWRVCFEPVPREQWVAVDVWDTENNCWARAYPKYEQRSILHSAQGASL